MSIEIRSLIAAILSAVVLCSILFYKKMEVTQAVLSYYIPNYSKDIAFIASVSPLYCLKGEVEALKWDALPKIGENIDFLLDVALPKAREIASNADAYDDASEGLKSSLLAEIRSVDASIATVKRTVQDMGDAEGFWATVRAMVGGVRDMTGLIDKLNQGWDEIFSSADEYVAQVTKQSMAGSNRSTNGADIAFWLFENVYSEKEKMELLTYTIDAVIDLAMKNAKFKEAYNTGCLTKVIEEAQVKAASTVVSDGRHYQFQVACLSNSTDSDIKYQWRWGDSADWTSASLEPRYSAWHSSSSNETFYIKLNRDASGRDPTGYWVKTKRAGEKSCESGRKYNFTAGKQGLDIVRMN